jgi:hypothetical protein
MPHHINAGEFADACVEESLDVLGSQESGPTQAVLAHEPPGETGTAEMGLCGSGKVRNSLEGRHVARRPWWQRIFPPVERLADPGSTGSTTAGVFLAYVSPLVLTISFVPLLGGDTWVGLGVGVVAIACWVLGHRLVGR